MLQIVNQITEVGKGTLEELEHQGGQLRTVDEDLDKVKDECRSSSSSMDSSTHVSNA